MNPYLILRVSQDADDAEIRRAYLEGVRKFPPEHAPEKFQAISQAYEQIRDEESRMNQRIAIRMTEGESPADVVAAFCDAIPAPKPLDFESMKAFLRTCTKS